jgi:hypothetical protein
MGKDSTTDRGYRVLAAEKKVAKKKAAKKTTKKKAAPASKKAKAAKPASTPVATPSAPEPVAPAPPPPATPPPSFEDSRGGGPMRGIVALWGPLAIIVLLIVVARIGDDTPDELGSRAVAGLSSSLETAEQAAKDVVDDVRDALTGGDPEVAAVLGAGGQGSSGSSSGDLAAAFSDAGVAPAAPKSAATASDPWQQSGQTTTPASVGGIPGALPPNPENPWAPVDPRAGAAVPAEPYNQGYQRGYQRGYQPGYGQGYQGGGMPPAPGPHYGDYPPPPGYPPYQPQGHGSAPPPAYGGRARLWSATRLWRAAGLSLRPTTPTTALSAGLLRAVALRRWAALSGPADRPSDR